MKAKTPKEIKQLFIEHKVGYQVTTHMYTTGEIYFSGNIDNLITDNMIAQSNYQKTEDDLIYDLFKKLEADEYRRQCVDCGAIMYDMESCELCDGYCASAYSIPDSLVFSDAK